MHALPEGRRHRGKPRKPWLGRLGIGAALVALVAGGIIIGGSGSAVAGGHGNNDKVTICHRTDSETNPYVKITVSFDAATGKLKDNGQGDHTTHTGDVWYPGHAKEPKWGDIIPSYSWPGDANHPAGSYAGLNWDSAGQAIWNNGCKPVQTPPPPAKSKVYGNVTFTEGSVSCVSHQVVYTKPTYTVAGNEHVVYDTSRGTHQADFGQTVDAKATGVDDSSKYELAGQTDWSHTFAGKPAAPNNCELPPPPTECSSNSHAVGSYVVDKATRTATVTLTEDLCKEIQAAGVSWTFMNPPAQWPQNNPQSGGLVTIQKAGTYQVKAPTLQVCGYQSDMYAEQGEAPEWPSQLNGPNNPYEPHFLSDFFSGSDNPWIVDDASNCSGQPPVPQPGTATAKCGACSNPGAATGTAIVTVTNPNDEAETYPVSLNGENKQVTVQGHGQAKVEFSGLAPGSYDWSVTGPGDTNVSGTVKVGECKATAPQYNFLVAHNLGSCDVRVPELVGSTEFAASIGSQLKGSKPNWVLKEQPAGDFDIHLAKVKPGQSVVYRLVLSPTDDSVKSESFPHSDWFTFSVPENCVHQTQPPKHPGQPKHHGHKVNHPAPPAGNTTPPGSGNTTTPTAPLLGTGTNGPVATVAATAGQGTVWLLELLLAGFGAMAVGAPSWVMLRRRAGARR